MQLLAPEKNPLKIDASNLQTMHAECRLPYRMTKDKKK